MITNNVINRMLHIRRANKTGSAFTIDCEEKQYGDVPCAVETQRQLGSRLRNHL